MSKTEIIMAIIYTVGWFIQTIIYTKSVKILKKRYEKGGKQ